MTTPNKTERAKTGLGAVAAGSAGSTLVDATLLIERIITHIAANKNTPFLQEQIMLAKWSAEEIGPRLAKLAGCRWMPNKATSTPRAR